jgi:hypothetical protein
MTPHADHPLRDDIDLVREMLLAAAPGVVEGIKWSAPSFRLADDFATFHLRSTEEVALILHTGAKKKVLTVPMDLNDPEGLIERLAPDRCMVRLGAGKTLRARQPALEAILKQWIGSLRANGLA